MNCLLLIMFLLENSAQSGKETGTVNLEFSKKQVKDYINNMNKKNSFGMMDPFNKGFIEDLKKYNKERLLSSTYMLYFYNKKNLDPSILKDISENENYNNILKTFKVKDKNNSLEVQAIDYINDPNISILLKKEVMKWCCLNRIDFIMNRNTKLIANLIEEEVKKLDNKNIECFIKNLINTDIENIYPEKLKSIFAKKLESVLDKSKKILLSRENISNSIKKSLYQLKEMNSYSRFYDFDKTLENLDQWNDVYKESLQIFEEFESLKKEFDKTLSAIDNFEDFKKFDPIQGI